MIIGVVGVTPIEDSILSANQGMANEGEVEMFDNTFSPGTIVYNGFQCCKAKNGTYGGTLRFSYNVSNEVDKADFGIIAEIIRRRKRDKNVTVFCVPDENNIILP